MYEFEILMKSGERDIIFGQSYQDALNRSHLAANQVECILLQEYVD